MELKVVEFAGQELKIPPTERGQARWRKIVDVAERHFVERGYANVTLATIVAESGGSLENVYKWFGGKEGLFLAVLSTRIADARRRVETVEFKGDNFEADISTALELSTTNVPFDLMRVGLFESGTPSRYRSKFLEFIENKVNGALVELFRKLREKHGVEYVVSDDETALVFIRYFRGLALEIALGAEDAQDRLTSGKQLLKQTLLALVKRSEGD